MKGKRNKEPKSKMKKKKKKRKSKKQNPINYREEKANYFTNETAGQVAKKPFPEHQVVPDAVHPFKKQEQSWKQAVNMEDAHSQFYQPITLSTHRGGHSLPSHRAPRSRSTVAIKVQQCGLREPAGKMQFGTQPKLGLPPPAENVSEPLKSQISSFISPPDNTSL